MENMYSCFTVVMIVNDICSVHIIRREKCPPLGERHRRKTKGLSVLCQMASLQVIVIQSSSTAARTDGLIRPHGKIDLSSGVI
jgi:hypothetical protein